MEGIKQINVENIVNDIKKEIEEKGYKASDLQFQDIELEYVDTLSDKGDFNYDEMMNQIHAAGALREVSKEWKVSSHRRVVGKVITFFKRLVRKMVYANIERIVSDQNNFNLSTYNVLQQMGNFVASQEELYDRVEELDFQFNKEVKKEIANLIALHEEDRKTIEELKEQIRVLKEK